MGQGVRSDGFRGVECTTLLDGKGAYTMYGELAARQPVQGSGNESQRQKTGHAPLGTETRHFPRPQKGSRAAYDKLPPLCVALLGRFQIIVKGVSVDLSVTVRTQSAVAYLAIHRDRWVSRHELAQILWPETDEDQARANLRKLLHQLRQHALLATLIEEEQTGLRWMPKRDVTLDVAELEAAAFYQTTRSLEYAHELYHGPLLPLVEDHWVQYERGRLQTLYAGLLYLLVERYLSGSMESQALVLAHELIRIDSFNEEYYRLCLRIHAARKDMGALKHTFDHMTQFFKEELGVGLSAETHGLFHHLVESLRADPRISARYLKLGPGEEENFTVHSRDPRQSFRNLPPPLENDTALEKFMSWLKQISATPVFYLWAPPGGGKTTWLQRVARMARERGWQIIFENPTARRVSQTLAAGRRTLFVVDGQEQRFVSWAGTARPTSHWPSSIRLVLAGTATPEALWGPPARWMSWSRTATLGPMSPRDILARLQDVGAPDPSLANEIMFAAGGLPEAVTQAIGLWAEQGVQRFSADEQWRRVGQELANRLRATRGNVSVDPQILAVCSVTRHVDPGLLSAGCGRDVSEAEYRSLADSGLCVLAPAGFALRGEVRRLLLRDLRVRQPLQTCATLIRALRYFVQGWDERSANEKEYIARECLFAIREYWDLNAEGYLLPTQDLELVPPSDQDYMHMYRLLKFWAEAEQVASSSRFSTEWDNLMSYHGNRIRVVKDEWGADLGFNVGVPVRHDSIDLLRQSLTTGELARANPWDSEGNNNSWGWVLRLVVYGPKRSAVVMALLEEDLLGLAGTASALYIATPFPRYRQLLPALGFRRISASVRWNNGKLHPIQNYSLELPRGFAHWVEHYCAMWTS